MVRDFKLKWFHKFETLINNIKKKKNLRSNLK